VARAQLEPAWVLSARPYRETSALVELFTRDAGRVGLVARGVRSGRARQRGLLQPFQPLLASFSERGELGTLGALEPAGAPVPLRGEAVFAGWYLNELLLRLLPRRDPHPRLFAHYGEALAGAGASAAALRVFEMRLLTELGYGLQLPEALEAEAWYAWDGDGGLRLAEPGPSSYRGASLRALAEESLETPESLRDARRLLRAALSPHLGERELRTPAMLRALRKVAGGGGRT
jgi:DNA repair protein RecO (recombination protein O)